MKSLLNEKGEPFISVVEYDGYLFPNLLAKVDVPKYLAARNELGFDGDEICIATYPKTGIKCSNRFYYYILCAFCRIVNKMCFAQS